MSEDPPRVRLPGRNPDLNQKKPSERLENRSLEFGIFEEVVPIEDHTGNGHPLPFCHSEDQLHITGTVRYGDELLLNLSKRDSLFGEAISDKLPCPHEELR